MSTLRILPRALALGLAAGARSTLGPCAPQWARARAEGRTRSQGLAALTIAGEFAMDKVPSLPARTEGVGLWARAFSGAWGGALLARNLGGHTVTTAAVAAVAAPVGALAGVGWRSWWSQGRPAWVGAVAEDVVALSLAGYAVAGTGRGTDGPR
ncbi:hypothetical protein [Nocardiopsis sp. MG754419]|uniref:hypothetical protein n=1 Tax=Nocardiopsis sp. MG754419 TaxID=2259865 RepID=UPI001BAB2F68|nr:hypothetical protein [Nocardiopsis sp. MG754419]MBR8743036.1 hypothetical protein [Nocardiopsis sp. MG754419]